MMSRLRELYLNLEKYLAYHVDFLIGLNNIAIGWSIILGPENKIRDSYLKLDPSLLGVLLLTSGIVLVLVSLTESTWKTEYFFFLLPPFVYLLQILRETTVSPEGSLSPNGFLFMVITLFVVSFLLMRRTGIRRQSSNE